VISHRQYHRSNPAQQPSARTASGGFTLIELMVVIVIIGVLIGLIAPAIFAAVRRAREAEVRTEISQLETGISAFKTEFGGAPPSRITFPDLSGLDLTDPTDRATATTRWNQLPRSKAIIRRFWGQFDFGRNGGGGAAISGTLNGAECLVFFLGGVRDGANGPLVGFSKNPGTPFATGGNRVGPFYDFELGRLTPPGDSGNPSAPEYLDPLSGQITPYIYLSGYDGRGYRVKELTDFDTDSSTILFPERPTWWTLTSWYTQSIGTVAFKPNSHQIISPGSDNLYGTGGVYDGKNYKSPSIDDEDNITNFSSGRLTP